MQKLIDKMVGYKATNADMTCTPNGVKFQFELGKWYEAAGDLVLCGNGFHFCVHPSGPWAHYPGGGSRVFKVEAEDVLDLPIEPGADFKLVAKRIRLVEEITPGGDSNTGDRNTGNRNTGNWNTGNWNTGNSNTGNSNTGDSNTGDSNTGDRNTGNRNTGNSNTGNWNTGNWNTGNWNTGNWNTVNFSAGMFCADEPKVISFDVQTKLTRAQFFDKYPEACSLGDLLFTPRPIDFARFKKIPGITKAKLAALHKAHLAAHNIKA